MEKEKINFIKEEYLSKGLDSLLKEKDWTFQKIFTDNWDINANDFGLMIKKSIGALRNFAGPGANPYSTMALIAEKYPDIVKRAFTDLFDTNSNKSTIEKVEDFRNAINKNENIKDFLSDVGIKEKGKPYDPAQGNASVISYLWFRYPDKYYQYVPKTASYAYQYLYGDTIKGSFETKYNIIKKFTDELKSCLYSDEYFYKTIKAKLDEKGFDINNTKVINHIVYFIASLNDNFERY